MEGAGDFGFAFRSQAARDPAGKRHLLFMGAAILGSIPLAAAGKVKDGDLFVVEEDAGAAICRDVFYSAGQLPFDAFGDCVDGVGIH
jgi:hypothetical protein